MQRSGGRRGSASWSARGGGASRRAGGLAHGAVPRGGVRDSVLHLWVLLPGAALLWGALPRDRATAPTAAGEPRGISAARKAGWITGTANGPTARGAASGA